MNLKDESGGMEGGVLTVHEVAKYLRLSEAKVYRLAQDSSIPAARVGKSWRFRKDLIDEWMRGKMAGGVQVIK